MDEQILFSIVQMQMEIVARQIRRLVARPDIQDRPAELKQLLVLIQRGERLLELYSNTTHSEKENHDPLFLF
jgi:hypothetical protein